MIRPLYNFQANEMKLKHADPELLTVLFHACGVWPAISGDFASIDSLRQFGPSTALLQVKSSVRRWIHRSLATLGAIGIEASLAFESHRMSPTLIVQQVLQTDWRIFTQRFVFATSDASLRVLEQFIIGGDGSATNALK